MLARVATRSQRALQIAPCERAALCRPLWLASQPHVPRCTSPHNTTTTTSTSTAPVRPGSTSSSSSTRWRTRQTRDTFAREAKVAALKSRAAFKLLEIHSKHHLLQPGHTVVDLGYAPGSWSQVAVNKVQPGGRVVGIDVIPAQPPRGVSTLQGDFLSPHIREELREYVRETAGRRRADEDGEVLSLAERGRRAAESRADPAEAEDVEAEGRRGKRSQKELDRREGRVVDVVLSDMCEPWPQVGSTWVRSVSNPYRRMMNTSGMAFRDHAGSMDLCNAALTFTYDTLVTGGHFLCKFYAGAEDHAFELRLKKLFEKVHRIKPDSSRKESKEAYFVCMRRRPGVAREDVFPNEGE